MSLNALVQVDSREVAVSESDGGIDMGIRGSFLLRLCVSVLLIWPGLCVLCRDLFSAGRSISYFTPCITFAFSFFLSRSEGGAVILVGRAVL